MDINKYLFFFETVSTYIVSYQGKDKSNNYIFILVHEF